jgi:hypothetical protein
VNKDAATNDRQTTVSMTVLMTPDMANFSGNVHGGGILKILDRVAFACASTYARGYVVTLSVDRVLFREAILEYSSIGKVARTGQPYSNSRRARRELAHQQVLMDRSESHTVAPVTVHPSRIRPGR